MEKKFPSSALISIRQQAMIYNCACPAQVCETISHLRKLHDYQLACENGSETDRAVHRRIAAAASSAHREMEQCLAEILRLEGWDPLTLAMPEHLEKRRVPPFAAPSPPPPA